MLLWNNSSGAVDDCDEEVDGSKGDEPRWIDTSAMLSGCSMKTMTSCRLNETLSAGIFGMGPTEESLVMKARNKGGGEHRRKSRNGCKILTVDISRVCNAHREYSLSTSSGFLRPRHTFFVVQHLASLHIFCDPAEVTQRVTGVTFSLVHLCHLSQCQHCTFVHFRRALES